MANGTIEGISGDDRIDRANGTDNLIRDVQTKADTTYALDFKSLPRDANSTESIEVYWNGVLVGTISPIGNTEWQGFSFRVIGTGDLDLLEVTKLDDEIGSRGPDHSAATRHRH